MFGGVMEIEVGLSVYFVIREFGRRRIVDFFFFGFMERMYL